MVVLGLLMAFFWLFFVAIILGGTAFWIWMIVDVATRKFKKDDERIAWVLVVVLAGLLGSIIYFFVVKTSKKYK